MRHATQHIICTLVFGLSVAAVAGQPATVGRVFDAEEGIGAIESSGRDVVDRELVRTADGWAIVRLENDHVLRFAPNSSAVLEGGSHGMIRVTVVSGLVAAVGRSEVRNVGAGGSFTLYRAELDAATAEAMLVAAPARPSLQADDAPGRRAARGR